MVQRESLIIAFVSDEIARSHIQQATQNLPFAMEWVSAAEQFGTHDQHDRPGEPLRAGQSASLTQHLTERQPNLLIFDLGNEAIPWRRWIGLIKSSAATRRLPIIAIAADSSATPTALSLGVNTVVTDLNDLENSITTHVRPDNAAAITAACAQPLSQLALDGIQLFNEQQFYEAHHGLEDAWNDDKTAAKDLYRAILQVAVAYLQIERGNYRGALKMFLRVRQWLDPLPAHCRGVNIAQLRTDAEAAHNHLTILGAEQITEFDRAYFKPIELFTNTSEV